MERCPQLDEIRVAFFREMLDVINRSDWATRVYVVSDAQEANPDRDMLLLLPSFIPGIVSRGELGGFGALARRRGIWKMSISAKADNDACEAWRLAEFLEEAFRQYTVIALPVLENDSPVCEVYCDFPYTENTGFLSDGRKGISVTIPWWAWTHN